MADKVAKDATIIVHDERIKVPYTDWKATYKEEITARTRNRNEAEEKFKGKKFFKEIYRKDKKNPWFKEIMAEVYYDP